jgi:hypothetical protein
MRRHLREKPQPAQQIRHSTQRAARMEQPRDQISYPRASATYTPRCSTPATASRYRQPPCPSEPLHRLSPHGLAFSSALFGTRDRIPNRPELVIFRGAASHAGGQGLDKVISAGKPAPRCPERRVRDRCDVSKGPYETLSDPNGPFETCVMSRTRLIRPRNRPDQRRRLCRSPAPEGKPYNRSEVVELLRQLWPNVGMIPADPQTKMAIHSAVRGKL